MVDSLQAAMSDDVDNINLSLFRTSSKYEDAYCSNILMFRSYQTETNATAASISKPIYDVKEAAKCRHYRRSGFHVFKSGVQ